MSEIVESFYIENANWQNRSAAVLEYIKRMSVDTLLSEIACSDKRTEEISPANVSQFSSLDAVDYVINIVNDAAEDVDFAYVGYMINKSSNEGAQRKYGENHIKLAIQMGLITEKPYMVTELGQSYMEMHSDERKAIRPKLFLRVPVVQKILIESKTKRIDGTEVLKEVLSDSTAIRRRSNIKRLIEEIKEIASVEMQKQITDNIYWS